VELNMELDEYDTRWPRNDDRLFARSSWAYDAFLTGDPNERFYRLPQGYKRAGDLLIEQASTNLADRPNVIYAALFCYRQSIELYLKRLIEAFGGGAPWSDTHHLDRLWDRFVRIVDERSSSGTYGLETAGRLVAEMHEADKQSDGFRFPADRHGVAFAFADRGIDLANVHEVMQG
jgi:hypothetical protein